MEEEKCVFCRGKGIVGGLCDGDEYIEVEDCSFCEGTGITK